MTCCVPLGKSLAPALSETQVRTGLWLPAHVCESHPSVFNNLLYWRFFTTFFFTPACFRLPKYIHLFFQLYWGIIGKQ